MTPDIKRFVEKPFRVYKEGIMQPEQYETQTAAMAVARAAKRARAKAFVMNIKTKESWYV